MELHENFKCGTGFVIEEVHLILLHHDSHEFTPVPFVSNGRSPRCSIDER